MEDQFQKSNQMTFEDLFNVTGFAGFSDGLSLSDLSDGQTTDRSGQALVPVNRSAQRAKGGESKTNGTSGRNSIGSSKPASRKSSSASKSHPQKLSALSLRLLSLTRFKGANTPKPTSSPTNSPEVNPYITRLGGSMEYEQTWKRRVTPSGLMYWEHTASARRTFDSDCFGEVGGWITPQLKDFRSGQAKRYLEAIHAVSLNDQVMLSGWGGTPSATERSGQGEKNVSLMQQARLAGWVSPTAQDHSRGSLPPRPHDTGVPLSQQVTLAGWPSPNAQFIEAKKNFNYPKTSKNDTQVGLPEVASLVLGQTSTLSPAQTESTDESNSEHSRSSKESRGALNPQHSRWLMGYPVEWCLAAIRAHRKRKRQPKRA